MTRTIATNTSVDRVGLLQFLRPRHRVVLTTTCDPTGHHNLSPVTAGIDDEGRVVVATYPERSKARCALRWSTSSSSPSSQASGRWAGRR